MNKEDILKKSRMENKGKHDECEMAAFAKANRAGMVVGSLLCIALVVAGELLFKTPEISWVGWLVYFAIQGSNNLVLWKHLKSRKHIIYGIVELLLAAAFAVVIVLKNLV